MEWIRRTTAAGMAVLLFLGMAFGNFVPVQAVVTTADIMINDANFPDPSFRAYVSEKADLDENGYLSREERDKVNTIKVQGRSIVSLKGVEYFEKLRNLSCEQNELKEIDVSGNERLQYLDCSYNEMEELDVTQNSSLTTLYCGYNRMDWLDVRQNRLLDTLRCEYNNLQKLDTSQNPALTSLVCDGNQLKTLSIDNNPKLISLSCAKNRLTSLDLSPLEASEITLNAKDNRFSIGIVADGKYDLDNLKPYGFELSEAYSWKGVKVSGSILSDFSSDYVTYSYDCGKKQNVTFNLSVGIFINENNFPDPAFRECVAAMDEDGDGAISLSESRKVDTLDVRGKKIADLTGVELFPNLEKLYVQKNALTVLDLTRNTKLRELDCSYNQLTVLGLSENPLLQKLDCSNNKLTTLDLSKNTQLQELNAEKNQLSSLGIADCSLLEILDCSDNLLETLAVFGCPLLKKADLGNNRFSKFDFSEQSWIRELDVHGNHLIKLVLTGCEYLESLKANDNELKSLDLGKCGELKQLDVSDNHLVALNLENCMKLTPEKTVASGNYRELGDVREEKQYNLLNLREYGFDSEKAYGWSGASENGGVLKEFTSKDITYSYDCGNGFTASFCLKISELPHIHSYVPHVVKPTCTSGGYTEYICSGCGDSYRTDYTSPVGHSYIVEKTPAGWWADGSEVQKCRICGRTETIRRISGIGSMYLLNSVFTYDGLKKKPPVVVRTLDGSSVSPAFYSVSYEGNVVPGTGSAVITFRGDYSGTRTLYFTINPIATKLKSVSGKSKKIQVKWEKRSVGVSGYQIQYSLKKSFSAGKTAMVEVRGCKKKSKTIKKLKAKKKYYVRIRTYVTVGGMRYYSSWSKAVKVKTKS